MCHTTQTIHIYEMNHSCLLGITLDRTMQLDSSSRSPFSDKNMAKVIYDGEDTKVEERKAPDSILTSGPTSLPFQLPDA